jgi:hypothetical protein
MMVGATQTLFKTNWDVWVVRTEELRDVSSKKTREEYTIIGVHVCRGAGVAIY